MKKHLTVRNANRFLGLLFMNRPTSQMNFHLNSEGNEKIRISGYLGTNPAPSQSGKHQYPIKKYPPHS